MADAIIIDDGGSTRIKQVKGTVADGKMDDLISEKTDQAKGKFKHLRIVFFDDNGDAHGPFDQDLAPGDSFVIESQNKQKIVGELNGARKLSLSLESDLAATCSGVDPLVDAKQHRDQRRYIVSNAGPIVRVSVNGATPALFDAEDTTRDHGTSVYTMVVLKQHVGP